MVAIGSFLLVAAMLIAPSVYTAWRDWRAANAVSAATGRPGQQVVAAGRAVTGGRGVVTAPLSQQDCLWYQQETRRHVQRPGRSGAERDMRVEEIITSDHSFGIADPEGRVVMVQPDELRQGELLWAHREERSAQSHERFATTTDRDGRTRRRAIPYETTGYETVEWIVAPDADVVVTGVLAPDGQLASPRRGPYLVRTTTLAAIRRRRARALALITGSTVVCAALGLAFTFAGI